MKAIKKLTDQESKQHEVAILEWKDRCGYNGSHSIGSCTSCCLTWVKETNDFILEVVYPVSKSRVTKDGSRSLPDQEREELIAKLDKIAKRRVQEALIDFSSDGWVCELSNLSDGEFSGYQIRLLYNTIA